MSNHNLAGKVALVTGDSKGIGAASVLALAEAGAIALNKDVGGTTEADFDAAFALTVKGPCFLMQASCQAMLLHGVETRQG